MDPPASNRVPTMPAPTIRALAPPDWPAVRAIYAAGIATGDASFETEPPSWASFDAARLAAHRWVATEPGSAGGPTATEPAPVVVGWVACTAVSSRPVYAGVVEHSVYVDPAAAGRGVGRALLAALIASTEAAGIWTIQSGIFEENAASLRLHERAGFRRVGIRERIGRHDGRWRDVVLLERRSPVVR